MRDFAGRLAAGQRYHFERHLLGQPRLARWPGSILEQSRHTILSEPLLPAPDRRPAHADRLGNRRDQPTLRRQQHDLCPLHVFVPPISIGDDRLQTSTIITAKQNAHCLCHGKGIAQLSFNVNLSIDSEH